jgi:NAD(P)-dependent dehydrogenase (short-subunit alcohol dehydrogenase family)
MATKLWAACLSEHDIPVYEIRPGVIMTDMTAVVKEKYDKLIAQGLCLQRRWGQAEDIGKAVAMIVRGDIAYSTGQVIMIDGGMTVPVL